MELNNSLKDYYGNHSFMSASGGGVTGSGVFNTNTTSGVFNNSFVDEALVDRGNKPIVTNRDVFFPLLLLTPSDLHLCAAEEIIKWRRVEKKVLRLSGVVNAEVNPASGYDVAGRPDVPRIVEMRKRERKDLSKVFVMKPLAPVMFPITTYSSLNTPSIPALAAFSTSGFQPPALPKLSSLPPPGPLWVPALLLNNEWDSLLSFFVSVCALLLEREKSLPFASKENSKILSSVSFFLHIRDFLYYAAYLNSLVYVALRCLFLSLSLTAASSASSHSNPLSSSTVPFLLSSGGAGYANKTTLSFALFISRFLFDVNDTLNERKIVSTSFMQYMRTRLQIHFFGNLSEGVSIYDVILPPLKQFFSFDHSSVSSPDTLSTSVKVPSSFSSLAVPALLPLLKRASFFILLASDTPSLYFSLFHRLTPFNSFCFGLLSLYSATAHALPLAANELALEYLQGLFFMASPYFLFCFSFFFLLFLFRAKDIVERETRNCGFAK
jgi:hypothetical protein